MHTGRNIPRETIAVFFFFYLYYTVFVNRAFNKNKHYVVILTRTQVATHYIINYIGQLFLIQT